MPVITLPDGSERSFDNPLSVFDVASDIGPGLAKAAIAGRVNGKLVDTSYVLAEDSELGIVTERDEDGLEIIRHSTAHLLAQAVKQLFPDAQVTIGPTVEDGFYYDFAYERPFTPEDLKAIEDKMKELAKADFKVTRTVMERDDAVRFFRDMGEEYKAEIIASIPEGQEISLYRQGDFIDLCRGPHVPDTGKLKAFKLMKLAGAYWRGDSDNEMLQRVYGTAWRNKKELKAYLHRLEEAKKRDHRKLGKELELFTFSQKVGQGLPMWLPKGAALRERLENFLKKAQRKAGYEQVITPHIGNKELYVCSGHYAKYGKDSFQPIHTPEEGEEYLLKPMNCPHHCELYKSQPRSYRDLPIRFAEFGTVYRYEQSGELHGLTRVRGFTQDDAHLFCMPDQLKDEFKKVIDLVLYILKSLDFPDFTAQISLRDKEDREKYIGSDENWEKAERAIIEAAEEKGLDTVIEYGEAAFYGPKLDFMVKDALGRSWQLGTIQVDYNLPERFELEYRGVIMRCIDL